MDGLQPVEAFVLDAAGRVLRGEPLTASDRVMLTSFRSMFPGLGNPLEISCTKPDHKLWSILVFPDEISDFLVAGHIARYQGKWLCSLCGNGESVYETIVPVLPAED